jgi:hypothetical protein
MPRRLPPHVERNHVKGHTYLSFRKGKGARIRLPDDPLSDEFRAAYAAALRPQKHAVLSWEAPSSTWRARARWLPSGQERTSTPPTSCPSFERRRRQAQPR